MSIRKRQEIPTGATYQHYQHNTECAFYLTAIVCQFRPHVWAVG